MAIHNETNLVIKIDPSKEREAYLHTKFLEKFFKDIQDEYQLEKWRYENHGKKVLGRSNQGSYGIIPNIGERVRSYDPRIFFRQMERDKDFWHEKSNVEKFAKDNPEVVCTK